MSQGNNVTLVGNMTRDPEITYTTNGSAKVTFGIACSHRWFNKTTNEWDEKPNFFNVTVWAQMAENVAASFAKGNRVVVVGRLEQRSWETDDGQKRSVVEVQADEVAASTRWAIVEIDRNEMSPNRVTRDDVPAAFGNAEVIEEFSGEPF